MSPIDFQRLPVYILVMVLQTFGACAAIPYGPAGY